jgi:hypothetical protein
VAIAERALRLEFPQAQPPFAPGFQYGYWQASLLGCGRPRPALSRMRVRTPKRAVVPLSVDEVARFWASFNMDPEIIQLLDHYLHLERPKNCGSPLFVGLKDRARGRV